jgi:hypothetical protein
VPLVKIEPEVAAKMPLHELWFRFDAVLDTANITRAELLADLQSGALIAWGEQNEEGTEIDFATVAVRGDEFRRWLIARDVTPSGAPVDAAIRKCEAERGAVKYRAWWGSRK